AGDDRDLVAGDVSVGVLPAAGAELGVGSGRVDLDARGVPQRSQPVLAAHGDGERVPVRVAEARAPAGEGVIRAARAIDSHHFAPDLSDFRNSTTSLASSPPFSAWVMSGMPCGPGASRRLGYA